MKDPPNLCSVVVSIRSNKDDSHRAGSRVFLLSLQCSSPDTPQSVSRRRRFICDMFVLPFRHHHFAHVILQIFLKHSLGYQHARLRLNGIPGGTKLSVCSKASVDPSAVKKSLKDPQSGSKNGYFPTGPTPLHMVAPSHALDRA